MKIAIDARELLGKSTGVGRYLRHILRQWNLFAVAGTFPHDLWLYGPAPCPAGMPDEWTSLRWHWRHVPGAAGSWWEQRQLAAALRADRPDVLFAPAYTSPLLAGCPVVQTIHDVSFLARPEWFTLRERLRRSWLTRRSALRARRVLTDSDFSAVEIRRLIGVPEHRLTVIPLGLTAPGVATPGSAGATHRSADAFQPSFDRRQPVVLFVGSIFNRRHVPDLIRAFARVAASVPDARLEIVGENRTYPHEDLAGVCREAGVLSQVSLRAYVSDAELATLYQTARAFAFLSEYEGFGLTPLEALTWGVPPVVLDTPVARATCGPAARYVGMPHLVEEAAVHLDALLTSEAAHRETLAPAAAVLARYRWDQTARATQDALEDAAR